MGWEAATETLFEGNPAHKPTGVAGAGQDTHDVLSSPCMGNLPANKLVRFVIGWDYEALRRNHEERRRVQATHQRNFGIRELLPTKWLGETTGFGWWRVMANLTSSRRHPRTRRASGSRNFVGRALSLFLLLPRYNLSAGRARSKRVPSI